MLSWFVVLIRNHTHSSSGIKCIILLNINWFLGCKDFLLPRKVCRDLLLLCSLSLHDELVWMTSDTNILLSKTTPSDNLLRRKKLQTARQNKKSLWHEFVSSSLLTAHMFAPRSALRGASEAVSVSGSPGESEKKPRREPLSRWCALMLAQNQTRILQQSAKTHQSGGLDLLYKYTCRCLPALFLWQVILNRLRLLSADT